VIPWTLYLMYGDTRILKTHYPSMVGWIANIKRFNPDYLWHNRRSGDYGDWVPGGAQTPGDVLATAVWAYDAWIMTRVARVLGLEKEAADHEKLYEHIKTAFIKKYVRPNGEVGNGSQTCYVLALKMGLLPDDLRDRAAALLVEDVKARGWHLSTGFIGTCYLMPTVTEAGYLDVAYKLLLSETYPSWGYVIEMGATSIWERWDGYIEGVGFQDPDMNSFNHYAFGAVGEWMFRYIAGIQYDMDVPGFKRIVIRPYPGTELSYAKAEYSSIVGAIVSSWRKETNGLFALDIVVPTNTVATVYVPAKSEANVIETGGSDGVTFLEMADGCAVYAVGGGGCSFRSS
jgi:alpha-L-rhamnosidase